MRQDHLDHERLETESVPLALHVSGPILHQPDDLGKVRLLRLLALAREIQMQGNARLEERAVILADQVAVPLGITVIEDRHNVHVQASSAERDRDAIRLRLDLIGTKIREGPA
jgi:hypothetical protein